MQEELFTRLSLQIRTEYEWLTPTVLGMTFSKPLAAEIARARVKHGRQQTPQNTAMSTGEKLRILVEEVGEVARSLTHVEPRDTADELLQVATMALLWYDSLTRLAPDGADH